MISKFFFVHLKFKQNKSIFFILGVLSYVYFRGSYIPHFCLFEELFNIKCSFCDLTYSFEQLIDGNIVNSLKINFLSCILFVFFGLSFIFKRFGYYKELRSLDNIFISLCLIQFLIKNYP